MQTARQINKRKERPCRAPYLVDHLKIHISGGVRGLLHEIQSGMQHKVVLPRHRIGRLDLIVLVQRFVLPHDDEQERGVGRCHVSRRAQITDRGIGTRGKLQTDLSTWVGSGLWRPLAPLAGTPGWPKNVKTAKRAFSSVLACHIETSIPLLPICFFFIRHSFLIFLS